MSARTTLYDNFSTSASTTTEGDWTIDWGRMIPSQLEEEEKRKKKEYKMRLKELRKNLFRKKGLY